jgi:phage regulator Rha-like protein
MSAKQLRASVIVKWLKIYNLRKVQYMAGHRYISATEAYRQNEIGRAYRRSEPVPPTWVNLKSQIATSKYNFIFTHMSKKLIIPDEVVMSKIYLIRGQKVMLDMDLAELYGVETKQLKRAVRRNGVRFPDDFMFELNKEELEILRSQIGTSSWGGVRYAPMAFTEQGVAMLSSVLNSERAVLVNIHIIRVFTRMREMLLTHKDILLKLEKLERKGIQQDDDIKLIFEYLKELLNPNTEPMRKIGFKHKKED